MRYVIVLICSLFSFLSAQNILVVDGATGNDSYTYAQVSGDTATYKWATIGRAVWGNATRPSSADDNTPPTSSEAITAGDTCYVYAGTYSTTQGSSVGERYFTIYNPVNEGTNGSPIVIVGVGDVEIQSDLSVLNNGGQPTIGCANRDYIEWNNFILYTDSLACGWAFGNGERQPAILWETVGSGFKNMTFYGNTDVLGPGNNTCGIYVSNGWDVYINNSYFSGFYGNSGNNNASIIMYNTNGAILEYNTFENVQNGIYPKAPLFDEASNNQTQIIIRYNWFDNISNKAVHFLTNRYGGSVGVGYNRGQVYQNVFVDCGASVANGPLADGWRDADSLQVYNNTMYNTQWTFTLNSNQLQDNMYYYNNILVGASEYVFQASADNSAYTSAYIAVDYNAYYNNQSTFYAFGGTSGNYASWQSTYSQDANSITGDPLFVNASVDSFQLQASSPCSTGLGGINMGAYITGNETIGIGGDAGGGSPPAPEGAGPVNVSQTTIHVITEN